MINSNSTDIACKIRAVNWKSSLTKLFEASYNLGKIQQEYLIIYESLDTEKMNKKDVKSIESLLEGIYFLALTASITNLRDCAVPLDEKMTVWRTLDNIEEEEKGHGEDFSGEGDIPS